MEEEGIFINAVGHGLVITPHEDVQIFTGMTFLLVGAW